MTFNTRVIFIIVCIKTKNIIKLKILQNPDNTRIYGYLYLFDFEKIQIALLTNAVIICIMLSVEITHSVGGFRMNDRNGIIMNNINNEVLNASLFGFLLLMRPIVIGNVPSL